nr:MAG: hypothetical protein DIU80_02550 [Chloroflexota bacterium]
MGEAEFQFTEALAAAERALGAELGGEVALGRPEVLRDATRCVVARCRVRAAAPAPATVVVKALRDDAATGFTEWASLLFLADQPGAAGVAPRLLAGDVARRVMVLEDLGAGETLEDVLGGHSPRRAFAALRGLAGAMARLHIADGEERFAAIRAALPAAAGLGRGAEAERWLAGRPAIEAWLAATGVPAPRGLGGCMERLAATYAEPGPWLRFTHGDPAPSNNHLARGVARLVDFEYGGFRHALYDIAAWNTLCPLPRPALRAMLRTFRAVLAETLPEAADDAAFRREWAAMCAFRALAILMWVSPAVLDADRPWVGEWTARGAVLAGLRRLRSVAAGAGELAPVAEAAAGLVRALDSRWGELAARRDLTPRWPALERAGPAKP